MRPGDGRVYPGRQDRSGCSLGLIGFIRVRCVRHGGHPVHHETLGSLACALGVVRFIWVRWVDWGKPWVSSCSSWLAGFIGVRHGVRQVQSWVHWRPSLRSSGSSDVAFLGAHWWT